MPSDKLAGTEDTVAGSGVDATLAAPVSGVSRADSGLRTPTTIGDSLRGANVESFESVDRSRYHVIDELARGGLGRVMRARDPRTGRIVALKEIIAPNQDTIARFAREALVTANLQHPSIVPVYEVGRWPNGEPFYAMKLVQGRTLGEMIAAAKTPTERLALLPHAIAVADALAYAHSERVIHRDLKPGNVLVGSYGETVVIDWGLARNVATGVEVGALSNPSIDLGTDTVLGTVIGTPSYMPPEQAHGAPLDEGADVYAIGALMYHMLSGQRPYADAKSVDEVVARVKDGPPASLAKLVPEAPPEIVAIVEKAMARSLSQRYRTAGVLAEDLRRYQLGKLVGAHRYTRWELLRRWVAKYKAILGVAALALVALIVVGAISVKRIASERDEAQQQRGLAQSAEKLAEGRYVASLDELARQALLAGGPDRTLAILAGIPTPPGPAAAILGGQARAAFAGLVGLAPASPKQTSSATISRDGKQLVVASGDLEVVAWDVERGTRMWTGRGAMVELSPDDKLLLVGEGPRLSVLAAADGKQIAQWDLGEVVTAGAWSPDSKRLALGGAKGAVAIATLGGTLVQSERHAHAVHAIAFSPDGAQLASVDDGGELSVRDDKSVRHFAGGSGIMYGLAWIDATRVVAGGVDHVARLWNAATGKLERSFDHGIDIYAIVPIGTESIATMGYGGAIKIWPIAGGPPRVLLGHRLELNAGVLLGDALVTADATGVVIAWDPHTGQRLRDLPIEGIVTGLVARGRSLVVFGDQRTRVWQLDTDATMRRITGHTARMRDFEVANNELWTASNDGTVRVHSLDGRERLVIGTSSLTEATITGPDDPNAKLPPNPHGARFIAFAPDGVRVATTYEDGRIVLRDRTTGAELATWTGHTGRVRALIFDGKVAYSVGDTTVRKWDATTGAELAHGELHGNGWTVAVRGDVVLTQTDRDDLALWAAATLSPGATPAVAKDRLRDFAFVDDRVLVADAEQLGLLDIHTGKFARVVAFANPFSSDLGAETIAMGTTHAEISILDRATLETLRSWRLGEGIVTTVKLRPDGKILASAGPNNVRIWDPSTGALLAERTDFPTMIMRIEWTPDGNHLVIMGAAATLWLWDLTPATPVASCITAWTLADSTLAPAPHTSTWCAPTPR